VKPDDGSSGRAPDGADFEAARVAGSRRRPPIAVLGWVVILGCVIAIGLSGRSGSAAGGTAAAPTAATTLDVAPTGPPRLASFRVTEGPGSPRFDPDFPTLPPRTTTETSAPGPIRLQATRHPHTVFVHGDVFAEQVTWVFVSLQTLDGQVGGWASVSIPGAAGEAQDDGPALRFDVELAVPTAMATGVLMVQANAYNAEGALIAATRVRLAAAM
jgi:hypothetical protein